MYTSTLTHIHTHIDTLWHARTHAHTHTSARAHTHIHTYVHNKTEGVLEFYKLEQYSIMEIIVAFCTLL